MPRAARFWSAAVLCRSLRWGEAAAEPGLKFSHHFLMTEWEHVVDAWQLETWEAYRDVAPVAPVAPAVPPQAAAPQAAPPAAAPAGETKFCFNCGTKIPRAAKFCGECGTAQPAA